MLCKVSSYFYITFLDLRNGKDTKTSSLVRFLVKLHFVVIIKWTSIIFTIEIQMPLYKSNGMVMDCLFGEYAVAVYITYTMATWDLPDLYALALRPAAFRLGHIYQANPPWSWYNYYINSTLFLKTIFFVVIHYFTMV